MRQLLYLAAALSLFGVRSSAQTAPRRPFVCASGQASVFVAPDQVKVDAGVETQASTAKEAAARNADQVAAVVASLKKLLGSGADIKTVNYFVGPVYRNSPNEPRKIVGYSANMTAQVTLGDLSMTGAVIDTATQAGATSIGALQFSLKDPEPAHLQALKLATLRAKAHADAIAAGLGKSTGTVISLQEGTAPHVQPLFAAQAAEFRAATTVTPGLIEVQASVALEAELI